MHTLVSPCTGNRAQRTEVFHKDFSALQLSTVFNYLSLSYMIMTDITRNRYHRQPSYETES